MIRLIEALNYRCLRHVRQPLGPFHVLVGPNASGKSTFLDVLAFLGRLVSDGLEAAVEERTRNFYDLVWGRSGHRFELAIEATIPEEYRRPPGPSAHDTIRYELAIGVDPESKGVQIADEQIWLMQGGGQPRVGERATGAPAHGVFRSAGAPGGISLLNRKLLKDGVVLVSEGAGEVSSNLGREPFVLPAELFRRNSVFQSLPLAGAFPGAAWLRDLLRQGVRRIELENAKLRQPSPPGKGKLLKADGGNLPWVVSSLEDEAPEQFANWVAHLQTALPDLEGLRVVERGEDRHRYLMLRYRGGLDVPSWMVSEGTLRMLALTVLAYAPGPRPVYLIEEPENSVHPLNIETIMQSLRSVYDGQVLVATHSPLVVGLTDPKDVLVFSRDQEHGTRITVGSDHPGLRDWRGEVSLGTLFAGGVFG